MTKSDTIIDLTEGALSAGAPVDEDGQASAAAAIVDEDQVAAELPRRAKLGDDGTVTLTLKRPISVRIRNERGEREETFAALTFRELVGADIRAISAASARSQTTVALARATGIKEAVMQVLFDRMTQADIAAAGEVMGFFSGVGRTTGT